jgi:hypothetical protein
MLDNVTTATMQLQLDLNTKMAGEVRPRLTGV